MSIKKLCSIGLLDIKLNLVLRKSFIEKNNFNINDYNSIKDIEELFYPHTENNDINESSESENENTENKNQKINYLDYISLSTDDNLLNTLFYINRAYKTKTFIEFIMPNEIKFTQENYFVKSLLKDVLNRNYFFIVENNIIKTEAKIKLIIKILNDENNEIISEKEFDLIEKNDVEDDVYLNNEGKVFDSSKLNYNFNKSDFLLIDYNILKLLKFSDNKDIFQMLTDILEENNKLKIILLLNDIALSSEENNQSNNNNQKKKKNSNISTIKNIIEFSDIIFSFKEPLNIFYKKYINQKKRSSRSKSDIIKYKILSTSQNKYIISSPNTKKKPNKDLIIYDNEKYRKDLPRTLVLLDNFNYATILTQIIDDIEPPSEKFAFKFLDNPHTDQDYKNNKKFLKNNISKCFHIFAGGYLSRFLNGISDMEECFIAGNMCLKNSINLLRNNADYLIDIDEYNVIVPRIKKDVKELMLKKKMAELRDNKKKEEKFVLDCVNANKSQKKEYNSLLDINCVSYLSKKIIFSHLAKNNFINKNGFILKDPGLIFKKPLGLSKKKLTKHSNEFLSPNDSLDENNVQFKSIYDDINKKIPNFLIARTCKSNKQRIKSLPKINIFNKNAKNTFGKTNYNWENRKFPDFTNEIEELSDRNNYRKTYGNLGSQDFDYNKYLFTLYQPNKKFKRFINNYEKNKNKY